MENEITEQMIKKIDKLSRRLYKINKKISEYDELNSDEFNKYYFISTSKENIKTPIMCNIHLPMNVNSLSNRFIIYYGFSII